MYDHALKNLTEFGLSEKEAKIYVSLLELGEATAFEISSHSGINRSSTYVVLEALRRRGLVGLSGDKNVRRYVAVSPEAIAQMSHSVAKRHEQIESNIKSILPELNALNKNLVQKPKIRVSDGLEGLMSALLECLNNKEKILRAFSSGENIMRLLPDYIGLWGKKRVELGIKMYGIYVDNKASRDLMDTHPFHYEVIYLPKKLYPSPVDLIISDDKVGYLLLEGNKITSIFVEAREIGTVMRGLFDMAFEEAKRMGGKYEEVKFPSTDKK